MVGASGARAFACAAIIGCASAAGSAARPDAPHGAWPQQQPAARRVSGSFDSVTLSSYVLLEPPPGAAAVADTGRAAGRGLLGAPLLRSRALRGAAVLGASVVVVRPLVLPRAEPQHGAPPAERERPPSAEVPASAAARSGPAPAPLGSRDAAAAEGARPRSAPSTAQIVAGAAAAAGVAVSLAATAARRRRRRGAPVPRGRRQAGARAPSKAFGSGDSSGPPTPPTRPSSTADLDETPQNSTPNSTSSPDLDETLQNSRPRSSSAARAAGAAPELDTDFDTQLEGALQHGWKRTTSWRVEQGRWQPHMFRMSTCEAEAGAVGEQSPSGDGAAERQHSLYEEPIGEVPPPTPRMFRISTCEAETRASVERALDGDGAAERQHSLFG
ncbi:unnamed protein product [Prorocentrum cordatum]|uniref:Uncharacterized protein n=1 Tax=Prorocentrum cordatum TaxID=2364126 RepID=A0ABN9UXZ7_9DINO|nr:unnamed protein product [Polarella glacialis]